MPWSLRDARSKTKKANTIASKRQWSKTANAVLQRTGSEGQAVRVANAAVKNHKSRKRR